MSELIAFQITLLLIAILLPIAWLSQLLINKSEAKKPFDEKIKRIKVGVGKSFVIEILGMPNKIFTYSNGDYEYIYTKTYGHLGEFSKTARIFFSNQTEKVLRVDKNF